MNDVRLTQIFRLDIDGQHIGNFTKEQLLKLRGACDHACFGFKPSIPSPEKVKRIITAVSLHYGLDPRAFLRTKRRPEYLVWPRFVTCQLLRDEGFALRTIAEIIYLAGDHGSALHALRACAARTQTDPYFRAELKKIRATLHDPAAPAITLLPNAETHQLAERAAS